jgi:hypothetical protein
MSLSSDTITLPALPPPPVTHVEPETELEANESETQYPVGVVSAAEFLKT